MALKGTVVGVCYCQTSSGATLALKAFVADIRDFGVRGRQRRKPGVC